MRRRGCSAEARVVLLVVCALAAAVFWAVAAGAPRYPEATGEAVHGFDGLKIDASNAGDGYIMAKYSGKKKGKLRISKDDAQYTYDFTADDYEVFPLQMGSGTYRVTLYQQVKGSQYAQAYSKKIKANMDDENSAFLYPNQYVPYTQNTAAVKKADALCADAGSDRERYQRVCDFVTGGIRYDYMKALSPPKGYLPDLDGVLESQMGICFDFAAVMASMLRSQGIPCKLIIGYADNQYHAWNETLIDGDWFFFDSTGVVTGLKVNKYTVERVY